MATSIPTTGTDPKVATKSGVEGAVDDAIAAAVSAHAAETDNPHEVTKAQVGLGNVDNTSDADKPVSTAQQSAIDAKADASALTTHTGNTANPHSVTAAQVGLGNVDNTADADKPVSTAQQAALDLKADASALDAKADASALDDKADATALALKADATALEAAEARTRFGLQPAPGSQPDRFRKSLASGGALYAAADVEATTAGDAIRLSAPGFVVLNDAVPIGPSDRDELRFQVRRAVEVADPAGDGVRFGVACFDSAGVLLTGDNAFVRVGADLTDLNAAGAEHSQSGVIARAVGTAVDVVLPAATRYYAPAVRCYGEAAGLDVLACQRMRLPEAISSNNGTLSPDAAGTLAARDAYDAEAEGFTYLATDQSSWEFYVRTGAAGTWAGPESFQGPTGAAGTSGATNFATFAEAAAWLAAEEPGDNIKFSIRGMGFLTQGAATSVPGLSGAIPLQPVFLDAYGNDADLSTDCSPAIAAAAAAGESRAQLLPGTTYLGATTPDLTAVEDFLLVGTDKTSEYKQGVNALPGIYVGPGAKGVVFENLTFTGNYDEAGSYDALITGVGVTAGSTAGTLDSGVSSGATSVTLNGLGTGWVRVGDRIEFLKDGAKYGYMVTTAAEISGGSVTLALNEGLDVALDADHTIFVKQLGNRQTLTQAYSAGVTEITFGAASVTGSIKAGDQFAFHTSNNEKSSIDYSEIYEVASDATYSGTYPDVTATVTLTEALATDKVKGQMITSIQDTRNNRHSAILFFGTEGCRVRDVRFRKCQLHAVAGNACVRSPWMGVDPEDNKNVDLKVQDCEDESTEPGSCFVSAHGESFLVENSVSTVNALTRNGAQAEQTKVFIPIRNRFWNKKTGIMATGEAEDSLISFNDIGNCVVGIDVRNITRRSIVSHNAITRGANYDLGIRAKAGEPDIDAGDDAFKAMASITENLFAGDGPTLAGTFDGVDIIVQPTRIGTDFNDRLRPHLIRVAENQLDKPTRHGIVFLQGAYVVGERNVINRPGYNGIYADTCQQLCLAFNQVIDAGQAEAGTDAEQAAYYLKDQTEIDWFDNEAMLLQLPASGSPQTYGIYWAGTNTARHFRGYQRVQGSTGQTNNTDVVSSFFAGFNAGRSSPLTAGKKNTGIGSYALASVTTADLAAALGFGAGQNVTTGRRGTFLGAQADVSDATLDNVMALGFRSEARQANELAIGDVQDAFGYLTKTTDADFLAGASIAFPTNFHRGAVVRWNGGLAVIPLINITDPNPPS